MMDNYAKEVEDFRFLPLKDEWGQDYKQRASKDDKQDRRLRVTIGVNGWLDSKEDVTKPWRVLGDESEVFALRFEMNSLIALGKALQGIVSTTAWRMVKVEILKRTVLATVWAALWPAYMLTIATRLDNPFSLAKNRSEKAGRVLADALINKVQGERPVTLIGYSLGARVIYTCLRSLAERRAFGLIDSVVLIGAPMPSSHPHWLAIRSVVSGKIFNVCSENDYILGFLYRAYSLELGVAGLQEVTGIEGVENLNLSDEVNGHLRYPELIGKILTRCSFPNIKGGEGAIEPDEDINLQEPEKGLTTGNLIQLDNMPAENPPESMKLLSRPTIASRTMSELSELPSMSDSSVVTPAPRSNRTKIIRQAAPFVGVGVYDPLGNVRPDIDDEKEIAFAHPKQPADKPLFMDPLSDQPTPVPTAKYSQSQPRKLSDRVATASSNSRPLTEVKATEPQPRKLSDGLPSLHVSDKSTTVETKSTDIRPPKASEKLAESHSLPLLLKESSNESAKYIPRPMPTVIQGDSSGKSSSTADWHRNPPSLPAHSYSAPPAPLHHDDDYSDDDDYGGGIRMIDNEEDEDGLSFAAPIPIDD
jgi:hypothetical protein